MNKVSEFRKPTREDYLKWFNQMEGDCGSSYSHFAITGHFGVNGIDYTRTGYEKKWWSHKNDMVKFFRMMARKMTDNRDWGKIRRENEMKVLVLPEVQENLHLHGILSLPIELNEFKFLQMKTVGNTLWKSIYSKGHFDIRELKDEGWSSYITKKFGYGDIIEENYLILPDTI